MNLRLSSLVLAVAAVVVTLAPSYAAPVTDRQARVNPAITMLGDSLTQRGKDDLQRRGLTWQIEGVPHRRIGALPARIKARLAQGRAPRVLVVAYGSNTTKGYEVAAILRDLALLPASTRVVLVTPYKVPSSYNPKAPKYQNPTLVNRYPAIFREVARQRPHTCIAPWASWAKKHKSHLLGPKGGGVHPDTSGQVVWARIIARAVARCS